MKNITIGGKEYPIAFNMKTIMNFEELTGTSFFGETFSQIKTRIALIMASVLTADENTELTIDKLMGDMDYQAMQEVIAAYTVVMELVGKFFPIPEIEKKNEPEKPADADKEEKPKN